jgi:hypothetical protein
MIDDTPTLADLSAKLDKVLDIVAREGRVKATARPSQQEVKLLSVREAARLYRISYREVVALIERGALKAAKRKARCGSVMYLVDAREVDRVLGAK